MRRETRIGSKRRHLPCLAGIDLAVASFKGFVALRASHLGRNLPDSAVPRGKVLQVSQFWLAYLEG